MRNLLCLAIVPFGLALVIVSPAFAANQFSVILDSGQEVTPPALVNPVNATGTGNLTLVDLGGGQYRWDWQVTISPELSFSNVAGDINLDTGGRQVGGFHIHNAARGANGSVVYGIFGPDQDFDNDVTVVLNPNNTTTIMGSWDAGDGNGMLNTYATNLLLPALPVNDVPFYFNAHTSVNAGGEMRGQIVAIPEPASLMLLVLATAAGGTFARRRSR